MGAAIMGTGIVSVVLLLDGHGTLSAVLLWIAVALAVLFAAHGLRLAATPGGRTRLRAYARHADVLTTVVGACVIGTRLVIGGHRWPGAAREFARVETWVAAAAWAALALAGAAHALRGGPTSPR